MRSTCLLLAGGAISDVAIHDDQSRAIVGMQKSLKSAGKHFLVICIPYARDIPPVPDKTGSYILAERPVRMALDRDSVVVINPAKIREFEMARDRKSVV